MADAAMADAQRVGEWLRWSRMRVTIPVQPSPFPRLSIVIHPCDKLCCEASVPCALPGPPGPLELRSLARLPRLIVEWAKVERRRLACGEKPSEHSGSLLATCRRAGLHQSRLGGQAISVEFVLLGPH